MHQHAHTTYEQMKANLLEHVRSLFPIVGRVHRLELAGLEIKDVGDSWDHKTQKSARMDGRTWSVPLHARFVLKDQSGRVIDRASMKIVDVPKVTNRGSYIVDGSEYMFPTQKRLRSGPYVRTGQNDELKTFFNMARGRNFHLAIHDRGHFVLQIDTSQAIPLYPILRALGVDDGRMVRTWGREAFVQNRIDDPAVRTKALKTTFDKMSYGAEAPEDLAAGVRALFEATEMDAANVELTLGRRLPSANGEALLRACAKMLRVGRGEEKEDNRDSLIHNDIVDLADFVVERFKDRQFRGRIERTIKFNLDRRDKIAKIVSRDAFQRPVKSLFTESQLSQSPTQTNPMGMMSDYTAITVRGEGGIQESNALTKGLRALDPSHLGFLDSAHTPEGSQVGTTLHMAAGTRKKGRDLVTKVLDVKTGRQVELTPQRIWTSIVAFPEALVDGRLKPGRVKATHEGEVTMINSSRVDYAFLRPEHLMDVNTANIPFVSHNNGARVMLASKLSVQAKPLVDPDVPMIQSRIGDGEDTIERAVGESFSPKSPVNGVVERVTDDEIVVSGKRVSIPNYFPLNNNNFVHARPTVKVGDRVKKNQVLADTTYTKDGQLAMGKNLLVAYTPYKGMNVEDGVVISRAAAQKMTSAHLYQQPYSFDADTVMDLNRYRAYFPAKINEEQARKLDDLGVIKKGQTLAPGDIMIASMRKQVMGTESQRMARISRILARDYRDDSQVWDKDVEGLVQDIARRPNEIVVHVRTKEPMRVGDKLVGRFANKGIVVHIIDDDEMPRDEKDRPVDMIMNPNGVVSRMNVGQILETTAGRIADKTGKPFKARGFGGDSANAIARDLKANGLKDHETLYDPVENAKIPGVLIGPQHIYKLEHQATKKISARGGGPDEEYTSEEQPVRGKGGGRAIGNMELYALLAHGSLANVHEMYTHKSGFDPEVWRAIESGAPLPPPKPSFAQQRFEAMLKGMGIHTHHEADGVTVVPFLDRQVKEISAGEITDHKLLRGKDLREEKNGLFDTKKTGGVRGDRWTHIKLPEPVPNPTFEKAVLSILHMKKDEFDEIMAGGKRVKGQTGGRAIRALLDDVDVPGRLTAAKKQIIGKSGSELNALHREIRYLTVLKERGLKPGEYVIDRLPVLPPKFRPVYTLPDGSLNVSDVNFHYQSTLQLSEQMKKMKGPEFDKQRRDLVPQLYKSVGGIMGLNEGIVERSTLPAGLAKTIAGRGSPKGGYVHSRLLKKRQDVSATNVVVANPKLGMDEIGLPEATAWKTFRPFLIRELRIMGMTPLQARKAVDDQTPQARKALERVVGERHVIINRAPTLHKFSVMAFKPKLVSGYATEVSPLIVGGYNMDFDGDAVGIHVPISAEANAEAANMLPSKHLYKPGSKKLQPKIEHEYVLGLFKISRPGPVSARRYTSPGQVLGDLRARKIAPNAAISVTGLGATTPGRVLINESLPTKLRDYQMIWTDKTIQAKLVEVDKVAGRQAFVKTLQSWADVGRIYAYLTGSSFLLSDLQTMTKQRNAAYRRADTIADRIRMGSGSEADKKQRIVKLYMDVSGGLQKRTRLKSNAAGKSNNVQDMMDAGARGNPNQVRQMVSNIGVMLDHENKAMIEPVRGTYTEGLDSAEFFQHMYGNRKGMIDRSQSVRDPGHLTKQVIVSAAGHRVSSPDCGTTNGIMESTRGQAATDRYLAEAVSGVGGRGTIVTTAVLAAARSKGLKTIKVRSPLTCKAAVGVCAKCHGLNEEGKLPPIGDHVGIKDAQGLTEPSTQLAMKCNAEGNLVTVRYQNMIQTLTLAQLWESASSYVDEENGVEIKAPVGFEIWDHDQFTAINVLERHRPDDEMFMVTTQAGAAFVSQGNHPNWARECEPACLLCGSVTPMRFKSHYKSGIKTCVVCQDCGHGFVVSREDYERQQERVVATRNLKDCYLPVSKPPVGIPGHFPLPPYLLGMALAEGCVSRRKKRRTIIQGLKKRQTIGDGASVYITGLSIAQNPGVIKNRIRKELLAANISFKSPSKKNTQINDVHLGRVMWNACGIGSANKRLPPGWDGMPKEWKNQLLAGLLDGDGSRGEYNDTLFYSTSWSLISQTMVLTKGLGYRTTVAATTNKKLTKNQCYCLHIYLTEVLPSVKKFRVSDGKPLGLGFVTQVKPVLYSGWTYDMATDSHSFTVNGLRTHNTFHTGGTASGKKDLGTGFDRVKQLFTMPDKVLDKATLAEVGGVVQVVRDLPQGGSQVTVGGRMHRVSRARRVKVKIGDRVEKGEPLTDGSPAPQDVLRLRGLRRLQIQLRDDVHDVYAAGGENIHPKTIETPVRMLTETVRISDPGDHPSLVTGDYSTYGRIDSWNRENAARQPVRYTHQLPGAEYLPHRSDDWAKRMAHNRIQQVLTEAPAMGATTRFQGDAPFGALIYGQRIKRDPWTQGGLTSG